MTTLAAFRQKYPYGILLEDLLIKEHIFLGSTDEEMAQMKQDIQSSILLSHFGYRKVFIDTTYGPFFNENIFKKNANLEKCYEEHERKPFAKVLKESLSLYFVSDKNPLLPIMYSAQLDQISHHKEKKDNLQSLTLVVHLFPNVFYKDEVQQIGLRNYYDALENQVCISAYNIKFQLNPSVSSIIIHELVHAGDYIPSNRIYASSLLVYSAVESMMHDSVKPKSDMDRVKVVMKVCQEYLSENFARLYKIGNLEDIKPNQQYESNNFHEFLSHYFQQFVERIGSITQNNEDTFYTTSLKRCSEYLLELIKNNELIIDKSDANPQLYSTQFLVIRLIEIFSEKYLGELEARLKQYIQNIQTEEDRVIKGALKLSVYFFEEKTAITQCKREAEEKFIQESIKQCIDTITGLRHIKSLAQLPEWEQLLKEHLSSCVEDQAHRLLGGFAISEDIIKVGKEKAEETIVAISHVAANAGSDKASHSNSSHSRKSPSISKQQEPELGMVEVLGNEISTALVEGGQIIEGMASTVVGTIDNIIQTGLDVAEEVVDELAQELGDVDPTQSNYHDLERDTDIITGIELLAHHIRDEEIIQAVHSGSFYKFYRLVLTQFMQIARNESSELMERELLQAELTHYINRDMDDEGNSLLHLTAHQMSQDHDFHTYQHHLSMVSLLLMLGASPNMENNEGYIASELAHIESGNHVWSSKSTHNNSNHNNHKEVKQQMYHSGALAAHVEQSISMTKSDAIIPFWVYSWCMLSKAFKFAGDFVREKCKDGLISSFVKLSPQSDKCDHNGLDAAESRVLDVVFEVMEYNQGLWRNNKLWHSEDQADREVCNWLTYLGCTSEQPQISDF